MGFLNISKQNLLSAVYKGLNILCSLLLVRFSIQFFGEETYGIWLALLSFITWFSALEVGITNALRQKITFYFTDRKFSQLSRLIGRGYLTLSKAFLLALIIVLIGILALDLNQLFIPSGYSNDQLKLASIIGASFYFIYYIIYFLNAILLSTHQPTTTYLITLIQNIVTLGGVLYFEFTSTSPSLLLICFWFSFTPLITALASSVILFSKKLKPLLPSFSNAQKELKERKNSKLIFSFLAIQISILIIFSTDNLIIVNFLSGEEVTKYNVSFRYFNLITVLFNLILLPYWASFTEAFHKKNSPFIKKSIRKLIQLWAGLTLIAITMLFVSNYMYKLWLGYEVEIPITLSLFTSLSIVMTSWYSIFSYFLNSINEVANQRNWLLFSSVLNLILSIGLIQVWGTTGVIMATCISLLPICIALPVQYRKIVSTLD